MPKRSIATRDSDNIDDISSGKPVAASSPPLQFRQLVRTPLVPEAVLKRHGAHCPIDTRFRAATRLQQALWLKGQNIETALNEQSNPRSFSGSILSSNAARAGKNFLNIDIHRLAVDAWLFCEDQAIFDPMRATQNALTSMALAFNLFGPLALNLELATAVFQKLFPDVQSVQGIIWEHAPARRGDAFSSEKSDLYLADRSAFDLAINVTMKDGPATIYVEVKLTEAPNSCAKMRARYSEASRQVRLYRDPDSHILRSEAVEQIWRLHMLSQLCVDHRATPRAVFVTVSPSLNYQFQAALSAYEAELLDADQREPDRVAFAPLTLETVIEAIAAAGASDLAQALWGRYCDLDQVYRLAMQEFTADTIEPHSPLSANSSSADTPTLPRTRRRMSSSRRGNSAPTAEHQAATETNVLDAKVEVGAP